LDFSLIFQMGVDTGIKRLFQYRGQLRMTEKKILTLLSDYLDNIEIVSD